MVKYFGVYLIGLSFLLLSLGLAIESNYGSDGISGNAVTNILEQPDIDMGTMDYAAGALIGIAALIMVVGITLFSHKGQQFI